MSRPVLLGHCTLISIPSNRNLALTLSAKTTRQLFITKSLLASFACLPNKKPSSLPVSSRIKIPLPFPPSRANLAQTMVQLPSTLLELRLPPAQLAAPPSNSRLSVGWEAWAPICVYQGRVVSPLIIFSVAFRASSKKVVKPVPSYILLPVP